MSTRHIIAAISSVAILATTIAIFNTSSRPRYPVSVSERALAATDTRPVLLLDPVVVYATPLSSAEDEASQITPADARRGLALPETHATPVNTSSMLFMPYYSFANKIHTIIKD